MDVPENAFKSWQQTVDLYVGWLLKLVALGYVHVLRGE